MAADRWRDREAASSFLTLLAVLVVVLIAICVYLFALRADVRRYIPGEVVELDHAPCPDVCGRDG